MYEIIRFLRYNKSKYVWMSLIVIQQFLLILYMKNNILLNNISLIDSMVLIFDLVSIIYIFIASNIRKNDDIFLKKIIIYISLICWHHFFILSEIDFWYDFWSNTSTNCNMYFYCRKF